MAGISQPDMSFIDQYNNTTEIPFEGTPTNLDKAKYWNDYESNLPNLPDNTYRGQQDTMGMYGDESSIPYTTNFFNPDAEVPSYIDASKEDIDFQNAKKQLERQAKWNAMSFSDKAKYYGGEAWDGINQMPPHITGIVGGFGGMASGMNTVWQGVKNAQRAGAPNAFDTLARQSYSRPFYKHYRAGALKPAGPHTKNATTMDKVWNLWDTERQGLNRMGGIKRGDGHSIYRPLLDYEGGWGNVSQNIADNSNAARRASGNPKSKIEVFRAVPKDGVQAIRPGEFVSSTEDYAKAYGDFAKANKQGDFNILKKLVNADRLHIDNTFGGVDITGLNLGYNPAKVPTFGLPKNATADDIIRYTNQQFLNRINSNVQPGGQLRLTK